MHTTQRIGGRPPHTRGVILATGPTVGAADLGLPGGASPASSLSPGGPGVAGFPENGTLADVERYWIAATPARCGGNQSAAAAALGIDRSTLHRKLRNGNAG